MSVGSAYSATTFTVDTTDDAADANPGDGRCATAAGQCSLRAAIQETNALPSSDSIRLPSGIYTMTIGGQGESASATGSFDINGDLEIHGDGSPGTVIDGAHVDTVIRVLSGNVVISDVTIERGGYPLAPGGDIVNRGSLTLNNSVITGGRGSEGAGILNDGTLTVNGSTITRNAGDPPGESPGGGILNLGSMTLIDATITRNSAGQGGGIASAGTASLTNVTISQNEGFTVAAGIVAEGDITLTNVTISGNRVSQDAGGMWNFGMARLTNVTMSDNAAYYGTGGIINHGTAILDNTIVSNNTMVFAGSGNCGDGDPITSEGHNLEDTDTCGLNGSGDLTNTDPKLGPLADNGGPTQTHALLPGSPAIDTGDNVACPTTDQRGRPRPADGDLDGIPVCDIGSYEFQPLPGTTTPSPTSTPTSQTSTPAPTPTTVPRPTPTVEPPMPSPTPTNSLAASPVASVAALPRTGGAPGGNEEANVACLWIGGLLIALGMTSLFSSFRRRRR